MGADASTTAEQHLCTPSEPDLWVTTGFEWRTERGLTLDSVHDYAPTRCPHAPRHYGHSGGKLSERAKGGVSSLRLLPPSLIRGVLALLHPVDVVRAAGICRHVRVHARHDGLWEMLLTRHPQLATSPRFYGTLLRRFTMLAPFIQFLNTPLVATARFKI